MGIDALQVGGLWGYVEAEPTIVGIIVGAIVVLALLYVLLRLGSRNQRSKSDEVSGDRG